MGDMTALPPTGRWNIPWAASVEYVWKIRGKDIRTAA